MPDDHDMLLPHCRVLVVEDSRLVAEEITEALERQGAHVVGPALNVGDALQLAAETRDLDAAVLDVNVGGEMIWPVADLLRRRGVKLVFSTGQAVARIKERYVGAAVIQKPAPARAIARLVAH